MLNPFLPSAFLWVTLNIPSLLSGAWASLFFLHLLPFPACASNPVAPNRETSSLRWRVSNSVFFPVREASFFCHELESLERKQAKKVFQQPFLFCPPGAGWKWEEKGEKDYKKKKKKGKNLQKGRFSRAQTINRTIRGNDSTSLPSSWRTGILNHASARGGERPKWLPWLWTWHLGDELKSLLLTLQTKT